MHQPDTSPRQSLFFDYQVYPFRVPADFHAPRQHRVAIVGAGPVGLVTALYLARMGVPSVLVTADQQVSEGSRALAYTRRSLEILQQVGAAEFVVGNGLGWSHGNSFYRGQRVFRLEVPQAADDRYAPLTNLQQQVLEAHLVELVGREPLIDLRWGTRVTGVEQDDARAVLALDTPAGPYALQADWVIATDGAKSTVRQQLGLRMEGASYEGRFVIVDIRVDLGLPTERLAYFDPPWNPGNTILLHQEPYGLWRFDYQLPPGESAEEALSDESIARRVQAQLAMMGHAGAKWEKDWSSIYSARALTLADYRHGRILFAGDAAHMLPIFGVRGLNTGWQDAQNLAWKLALVAQGLASPALLDSYTAERVAAAREIIDEATKSTRFMTPPTPGFRALRDAVLSLSLKHEFVRPLLHWRTSRPHEYTHSPLNAAGDDEAAFHAGPPAGAAAVNVRLGPDEFLLDRLTPAFQVLCLNRAGAVPQDLAAAVAKLAARGLPIAAHGIGAGQADGRVHAAYGADGCDAVYLLRPDQHVMGRWRAAPGRSLAAPVAAAVEGALAPQG